MMMEKRISTTVYADDSDLALIKGAVSRNPARLGNYKMSVKLRETLK